MLNAPISGFCSPEQDDPLFCLIDADGSLQVNGQPVSLDGVIDMLSNMKPRFVQGRGHWLMTAAGRTRLDGAARRTAG